MSKILTNMYEAVGKLATRDIFSEKGILLIPANAVILEEHIHLFQKHNILIREDDITDQLEPNTDPHLQKFESSVSDIQEQFDYIRETKKVPLDTIQEDIVPLVQEATSRATMYDIFSSLQAKDDYTYRHNLAVGTYSGMLGNWLGLKRQELLQLTTAALLHDVGKMLVPEEILNKPGELTDEEFEEMKRHTIYGYELLQKTEGINERQALVALQHHERLDGSGYPYGISGDKIDLFSRIVAVADSFHAMTSDRVYQRAKPFYEVLVDMNKQTYGAFDPKITNLFIQKLMTTLIGQKVTLTDGRTGIILMVNLHDPIRPLVQVGDEYVDLSKDYSIHIRQVL